MLIGLDYDDTYTKDPIAWRAMISIFRSRGHDFVMVTGRSDEGEYGAQVKRDVEDLMPIVFAAGAWKRIAADAAGHFVDVWIDDNPEWIAKQHLIEVHKFKEEQTDSLERGFDKPPSGRANHNEYQRLTDLLG